MSIGDRIGAEEVEPQPSGFIEVGTGFVRSLLSRTALAGFMIAPEERIAARDAQRKYEEQAAIEQVDELLMRLDAELE